MVVWVREVPAATAVIGTNLLITRAPGGDGAGRFEPNLAQPRDGRQRFSRACTPARAPPLGRVQQAFRVRVFARPITPGRRHSGG